MYSNNIEKERLRSKQWRRNNPSKSREVTSSYAKRNKEKLKAANKIWIENNKEKVALYFKKSREKHAIEIKARTAVYQILHRKQRRINQQNREAKKRENGGILSKDLAEKLFKLQKGRCTCCGKPLGENFHLDHKTPIALGGVNEDWNIQLLRQKCNREKAAKHPIAFMQSRGFLL